VIQKSRFALVVGWPPNWRQKINGFCCGFFFLVPCVCHSINITNEKAANFGQATGNCQTNCVSIKPNLWDLPCNEVAQRPVDGVFLFSAAAL